MTIQSFVAHVVERCTAVVAAVLSAVLFSIIVMLPSFLQRNDSTYPYDGIHMLGPDAEVYYAARVREVYDGFPWLGNVFFSAPKDTPYIQPPLPEVTIATVGRLAGLDAITAFMASKAMLSFVVFLLFFALLSLVTRLPWVSLISTIAVLFGGALLSAPWDLPLFLDPTNHDFEFLRFSRAINPQWSVSWFLASLIGLGAWIQRPKQRFLILTAVTTVILVYSYVYAWTYVFAVMGLATLWYAMRCEWSRVLQILLYWLIVGICSLPYAIHLHSLSLHPFYVESSQRFGLVLRHGPPILGVWLTVFLVVCFATHRLWRSSWPLLPITALAGLIAINQHVVTGHFIVPHHYHWYFIQPLASAFVVATFLSVLSRFIASRYHAIIGSSIVLIFFAVATVQQWRSYEAMSPLWGGLQRTAPVLTYIEQTMRPGDVIYTPDIHVADQVAIYTSADVYLAGNAANSLIPKERFRFIYFFELWLQGYLPEQAEREFGTTLRWTLSSRLYSIYYREAAGDFVALPEEEVAENIALYREFHRLSLREKLTRYPLTAVLTTPADPVNAVWSRFLACSTEVFRENGYAVRVMIPAGERGSCL